MSKSFVKVSLKQLDNEALEFVIDAEIKRPDLRLFRLTKYSDFHRFRIGNEDSPEWERAINRYIDHFLESHGLYDQWEFKEYSTSMKSHAVRKFKIVLRTQENTSMPENALI